MPATSLRQTQSQYLIGSSRIASRSASSDTICSMVFAINGSPLVLRRCCLGLPLLHMNLLKAARFELPLVTDLDVFVVVKTGPEPRHVVARVAQFNVAAAARLSVAFEFNDVIVDVRARGQIRQSLAV